MSEVKSSKKRKHAAVEASTSNSSSNKTSTSSSGAGQISVSVSKDAQKNGLFPVFASTPAISLTEDTTFTLYRGGEGSSSSSKGKEKERQVPSMLHGESSKLEWTSTNRLHGLSETGESIQDEDEMGTECSASYALALYDPSTSSISVINAPLHILSQIPKRLKALPSMISDAPSGGGNAAARAELGLSFGTKKSIKAIRAAERNKVDAGAADLQSLQEVMMQDLSKGLETLPEGVGGTPRKVGGGLMNEEELEAAKSSELQQVVAAAKKTGRPVPDIEAILPEQVYKIIGEIILEKELEAINPSPIAKLSSEQKEDAIRMLPYKLSHWVNDRVKELVQNSPKDKKRKLKILIWISGLMAIKNMGKQGIDPTKEFDLKKRIGGGMSGNILPPACSASLLERFAETVRGSKNLTMSSSAETRILCYIFLACLYYEGYSSLDINLLQSDLSLNPKKTSEVVKSLGCRILTPKGADTEKLVAKWQNEGKTSSIPSGSNKKVRIASLKIPLEFPRERKMAAKR